MSEPRIFLHPDGRYLSIGFTDTNDTLLPMPDPNEAWRDWERAAAWAEAVGRLIDRSGAAREEGGSEDA